MKQEGVSDAQIFIFSAISCVLAVWFIEVVNVLCQYRREDKNRARFFAQNNAATNNHNARIDIENAKPLRPSQSPDPRRP